MLPVLADLQKILLRPGRAEQSQLDEHLLLQGTIALALGDLNQLVFGPGIEQAQDDRALGFDAGDDGFDALELLNRFLTGDWEK